MPFFSSGLLGRSADVTHDLEAIAGLVKSGVLFPLQYTVHAFLSVR